jgi:hypothetical protein
MALHQPPLAVVSCSCQHPYVNQHHHLQGSEMDDFCIQSLPVLRWMRDTQDRLNLRLWVSKESLPL